MKLKYMAAHGNPAAEGIYWVSVDAGTYEEKGVAKWTGAEWVYTDHAPEHLWGEPYWYRVLAWVENENNEA